MKDLNILKYTLLKKKVILLSFLTGFLFISGNVHAQSCWTPPWGAAYNAYCPSNGPSCFNPNGAGTCDPVTCTPNSGSAACIRYCNCFAGPTESNYTGAYEGTYTGAYESAYETTYYTTPTYSISGTHFKDFNNDGIQSGTNEVGVGGLTNTRSGNTQTTQNNGTYYWNNLLNGTYTITAGGSVCGWTYATTSKSVTISNGNRIGINFPLRPNGPTNLVATNLWLRDAAGNTQTVFDSDDRIYPEVRVVNNGTVIPYSSINAIEGAISQHQPSPHTGNKTLASAANPPDFRFSRDNCLAPGGVWRPNAEPNSSTRFDFSPRRSFQITTPGSYTARVFLDYHNKIAEGGSQAVEVDDNQATAPFSIRSYTISGTVFIDANENGIKDNTESLYTSAIGTSNRTVKDTNGTSTTLDSNGNFTFTNRKSGTRVIVYDTPPGYTSTLDNATSEDSYSITLNDGTSTISPCGFLNGPSCTDDLTVSNIHFGIKQNTPWLQAYGLNARFDSTIPMASVPSGAHSSYGASAMKTYTNFPAPGTLISGNQVIGYNVSDPTYFNYKVGGTTTNPQYPDTFNSNLFPLKSSYTTLIEKLGDDPNTKHLNNSTVPGYCSSPNYDNCIITSTLPSGVYRVDGHLGIDGPMTLTGGKWYIFLVRDFVVFKEAPIRVDSGSTLLFSSGGSITFRPNVGRDTGAYTTTRAGDATMYSYEGFYVTDSNININSRGTCAQQVAGTVNYDKQLWVDGALVANAAGKGGSINNNRKLCQAGLTDATHPSLIVRPRIDLILNTRPEIKSNNFIWREVAP